jgi:glycosyltransferase involved in cell wall biosynthesis
MFDNNAETCEACLGGNYVNCAKKNCIHNSKVKSIVGTAEATLYKVLGTYKYIDTVICPSEFIKTKLDSNPVLADKTVTLPNFIDRPEAKDTNKEDYVIYFGRYSKEKGIETVLNAKNINFICAGTGDFENEVNAAPHIKNVGFQTGDALADLIRNAKCSVCPSICYDNCPFSVMESIVYGTPVVGSDIGGIPELIENGKTGKLFKSGDTEDFEKAINEVLLAADEMSKNCLVAEFDTVKTYCEKLLKIYTE